MSAPSLDTQSSDRRRRPDLVDAVPTPARGLRVDKHKSVPLGIGQETEPSSLEVEVQGDRHARDAHSVVTNTNANAGSEVDDESTIQISATAPVPGTRLEGAKPSNLRIEVPPKKDLPVISITSTVASSATSGRGSSAISTESSEQSRTTAGNTITGIGANENMEMELGSSIAMPGIYKKSSGAAGPPSTSVSLPPFPSLVPSDTTPDKHHLSPQGHPSSRSRSRSPSHPLSRLIGRPTSILRSSHNNTNTSTETSTADVIGGEEGGLRWRRPRRGSLGSDPLSASVRGKGSRDRQGWGNMPVGVIHNILDFVLETVYEPEPVAEWIEDVPGALELATVIARRVYLCTLRRVSIGWRNAVDSYAFWPEYTLLLDPSRGHRSTLDDWETSSLTPSTPSFPTLFHRARHTTLSICLACRLNHPSRLGLYPALRKRITYTTHFGWAPTCDKHHDSYCVSCLNEGKVVTLRTKDNHGNVGSLHVVDPELRLVRSFDDTDDEGRTHGDGLVCKVCRNENLLQVVLNILKQCEREVGNERSLAGQDAIEENWDELSAVMKYAHQGEDTLSHAARNVVDEMWLIQQTRWDELKDAARKLNLIEETIKRNYLVRRVKANQQQIRQRLTYLAELEGSDDDYVTPERVLKEHLAMEELYKDWDEEVEAEMIDVDELRGTPMTFGGLDLFWWRKMYTCCIADWASDRVRFGFWMAPSDELALCLGPHRRHVDPLYFLGHREGYYHAFPRLLEKDFVPFLAMMDSSGLIYIPDVHSKRNQKHNDCFLPTQKLLEALDTAYVQKLKLMLRPALVQCAEWALQREGTPEAAEKLCSTWSNEALRAMIRRQGAWTRGGFQLVYENGRKLERRKAEIASKSYGVETVGTAGVGVERGEEEDTSIKTSRKFQAQTEQDVDMSLSIPSNSRDGRQGDHHGEKATRGPGHSPRIELVVDSDHDDVFNPANIQELETSFSPVSTTSSSRDHSLSSVKLKGKQKGKDDPARYQTLTHRTVKSIDDVLDIQNTMKRRSEEREKREQSSGNAHADWGGAARRNVGSVHTPEKVGEIKPSSHGSRGSDGSKKRKTAPDSVHPSISSRMTGDPDRHSDNQMDYAGGEGDDLEQSVHNPFFGMGTKRTISAGAFRTQARRASQPTAMPVPMPMASPVRMSSRDENASDESNRARDILLATGDSELILSSDSDSETVEDESGGEDTTINIDLEDRDVVPGVGAAGTEDEHAMEVDPGDEDRDEYETEEMDALDTVDTVDTVDETDEAVTIDDILPPSSSEGTVLSSDVTSGGGSAQMLLTPPDSDEGVSHPTIRGSGIDVAVHTSAKVDNQDYANAGLSRKGLWLSPPKPKPMPTPTTTTTTTMGMQPRTGASGRPEAMLIPDHLKDASEEDVRAIMEAMDNKVQFVNINPGVEARHEPSPTPSPHHIISGPMGRPTTVPFSSDSPRVMESTSGSLSSSKNPTTQGAPQPLRGRYVADNSHHPGLVGTPSISHSRASRQLSKIGIRPLEPVVSPSLIPYVPPIPMHELGPITNRVISELWWEVRASFRECRCGICERRRGRRGSALTRVEAKNANLANLREGDEGMVGLGLGEGGGGDLDWAGTGDGGKRMRIG